MRKKRYLTAFGLIISIAMACSSLLAQEGQESLQAIPAKKSLTPKEVSQARSLTKNMFDAIDHEDLSKVKSLMAPERFEHLYRQMKAQGLDWKAWFAIWKKYKVVRIGDPVSTGNPGKYRIPVDYQGLSDSVMLVQEQGQWYWDEN